METMESAFKECFDQLPTGVFIVRQDTYKVLYCNNAMTRMSNGRIEPGATCYEALRRETAPCIGCYMQRRSRPAHFYRWYSRNIVRDFSIRTAIIEWEKLPAYVIFCTDLNENFGTNHHLEKSDLLQKLEDSLTLAEKTAKAKSEFLSRMSHDIRTPMNAIIGMTNMALSTENPPHTTDCLQKIKSSSPFLLSLINDILDVSKIESQKLQLSPLPYPLTDFLQQIRQIIQPLCKEKNIRFTIQADIPQDSCILVDPTRFNQIFLNLLSNAVKYTPPEGSVGFIIENYWERDHLRHIHFTIRDTGIGMSASFQKRMFEPFSQEDSRHINEAAGTGLGLAIVKSLVDLMKGSICVKSAPGCGSTFTIDLELPPCTSVKGIEKSLPGNIRNRLAGLHILLCEDNSLNTEVANWMLQQAGITVSTTENGLAALNTFMKAAYYTYDAILMDIRMPVLDGLAATRRIRELARPDAKTIPIIAMTADAFDEDRHRSLQAGMNAHLSKPLQPDMLYRILLQYTDRES